ncbi:hypothetical protein HYDPIDRAFT_80917 [Hydnomerulius pinastri MD-312]|nr:hypothetical protein HYDPIDRAFT_80917 [Hydnomerulius pinastri MD-312]
MDSQPQIPLGTRFCLPSGHLGTIKYVGHVMGTQGLWYGVEWDDPNRGKHNGVKDGKQYFNCRVPNAGSFIRPSASLGFGQSFLTALNAKYIEAARGSATMEKIVLGSSNGAIEVEAVGLDKIRSNLAALERLREVSLDNEKVAVGDTTGKIHETCPNIQGLDLSASLLSTWQTVSGIVAELPRLERLALNRNRFLPPEAELSTSAFLRIRELQLNSTLISWEEFREVASFMTSLQAVQLGYNRLKTLTSRSSPPIPELQVINFDGNELDDWIQVSKSLSECTALQRLILSSNGIRTIPPLGSRPTPFGGIKNLALSGNQLNEWRDIDTLAEWCPNLESLSVVSNPLTGEADLARYSRQFVVAKIPSLRVLDSAAISTRERTDCELFYLSFVSKNMPGNDDARAQEHPQWIALCNKHGRPADAFMKVKKEDKLSKSLIAINVQRCLAQPDARLGKESTSGPPISLQILSTMKMGVFRSKLIKSLKLPRPRSRGEVQVWLRMSDGCVLLGDDEHNLEWYGIEEGSHVLVCTREHV